MPQAPDCPARGCGRVYLVGAGPGDPGLLTLRGAEVLGRAEVVVYDALAPRELLRMAPATAELIYVGKRPGARAMAQGRINELLVARARAGHTVVRLKGGDPFVFGRGSEEALALAGAGVPFEVVPGVTAGVAAPACAGIPVTHRGLAGCVTFVTGHESPDAVTPPPDWAALARTNGTLVVYMGVGNMEAICRRLIDAGLPASTPAAAVERGATPGQRTVSAPLGELAREAAACGLAPPAVVVVGRVTELRKEISWFERRPLFGQRVLVTRARDRAPELSRPLRELGAQVVEFPVIRIEPPEDEGPLRRAAAEASSFDWIAFTSANGVEAFFGALTAQRLDARSLAGCRLAAIGPATARSLRRHGLRADLVPKTYTSAALSEAMAARGLVGRKVLCPRADGAPDDLVRALERAGATVSCVTAYRVGPETPDPGPVLDMLERGELDWVTFTSASTVRNLVALLGAPRMRAGRPAIASIGPATSAAVRGFGLEPSVEADRHTIEGLVEAILRRAAGEGAAP